MTNPPLASAAVGVVEPRRSGMASGINSTFRQVGIATGIAGLGAIFQARVQERMGDLLAGVPLPAGRREEIAEAVASGGAPQAIGSTPAGVRGAVADAAREGFVGGLNEILLVGAVVAFVGALLALALVRGRDFVLGHEAAEPAPA